MGDARADPKSRNMQDQATPMKLRMSHTMDTETASLRSALVSAAGAPCPVFIL